MLVEDWPTVPQNEKVSPFFTMVLFKVLQVIEILFWRAESLEYILVEKVAICSSFVWGAGAGAVSLFSCAVSLLVALLFVLLSVFCVLSVVLVVDVLFASYSDAPFVCFYILISNVKEYS